MYWSTNRVPYLNEYRTFADFERLHGTLGLGRYRGQYAADLYIVGPSPILVCAVRWPA
jgi:hypothetical protein